MKCLNEYEEVNKRAEIAYVYINLRTREDVSNSFYQERLTKIGMILNEFSAQNTFIYVEIKKLPNKILKQLQKTSKFSNFFKSIIRNKKHILSEKEEKILSMSGDMAGGFSHNFDMFDDADLTFSAVKDSQGKKLPLNHSTYMQYMQSEDRILRKNALKTFNGTYGNFNNFLASNYISNIKKMSFMQKCASMKAS